MLHHYGKTVGGMFVVLCLVSTVAVAVEMTCRASDGKGNCTAAVGPDGREIVVVGEGLKPGDKMECVDRGTVVDCIAQASPEDKAAPAASQSLPSGTLGTNLVTATARVKAIDLQTRHVTLERADGSEVMLAVDDTVRNLPQLKVGDEVKASYYESLAYEVKKPGTAAPGVTVAEEAGRAKPGEKPAGAAARVTTAVFTIRGIDTAAGTVTLQGPTGGLTTIKVRDPRNLERVAVGDLVEATYTEALAVAVDKPGQQ